MLGASRYVGTSHDESFLHAHFSISWNESERPALAMVPRPGHVAAGPGGLREVEGASRERS